MEKTTPQAVFAAERTAHAQPLDPALATRAADACVDHGLLARATTWHIEALCRHLGSTDTELVAAARSHGLLHLAMHLEAHTVQLTRYLLRVPDKAGHMRGVERACGGETAVTRRLTAAARSGDGIPRAAAASVIAQCLQSQDAFGAALVGGVAGAGISRDGHSALHLAALFGDPEVAHAVALALPPAEAARQLGATSSGGLVPWQLASRRGYAECAAELRRLARSGDSSGDSSGGGGGGGDDDDDDEQACPGAGCGASGAGQVEEAVCANDGDDGDGGWDGGLGFGEGEGEGEGGCDVAVAPATLSAAEFARRFARRELPVLVRNGSAESWAELRRHFSRASLVRAHGTRGVRLSAVPYHDDGAPPVELPLREFARRVA